MDHIQAPIIAVIGGLIRETPGTISLGQGIVHYGPPLAAIDAIRLVLDDPATHEYGDGMGLPLLIGRITEKLATENGIDVADGSRVMVTAGANMAFMHAVLATTSPGDEIILPVPFYFNHDMAIEMAGCRAVRVPTDDRYQLRIDAITAALTSRTRAIVTISPNNPSGAVFSESSLREVNAICRARGLYHIADEPYRVLHVRVGPTRLTGVVPWGGRPHDLHVLTVEGVRLCGLAHRLHGVSGAPRLRDDQEPGHDPDLSDDCCAGGRRGGAQSWVVPTASRTCGSLRLFARSCFRSCRRLGLS